MIRIGALQTLAIALFAEIAPMPVHPLPVHTVPSIATPPPLDAVWDDPAWAAVPTLTIDHFHPRSSDHRPRTTVKLLADPAHLHLLFRVEDRYVISLARFHNEPVSLDSCVEFFFQPDGVPGYFNLELNAGGVMLCSYVEDHRFTHSGLRKRTMFLDEDFARIGVHSSLPRRIPAEITEPVTWTLAVRLPLAVLHEYVTGIASTGTWRANFYKTAGRNSHPHYAAWADMGEELNFHQPERFGRLVFTAP